MARIASTAAPNSRAERAFAESDAVLAGACAVEGEGVSHNLVAEPLDFGEFFGGVRIDREHDVEVAVADVAEQWGRDARRFERLFGSADALGEI